VFFILWYYRYCRIHTAAEFLSPLPVPITGEGKSTKVEVIVITEG